MNNPNLPNDELETCDSAERNEIKDVLSIAEGSQKLIIPESDFFAEIEDLTIDELTSLSGEQYPITPIPDEDMPDAIDFRRKTLKYIYYEFAKMAQFLGVPEKEIDWNVRNFQNIKKSVLLKLEQITDNVFKNGNYTIEKSRDYEDAPQKAKELIDSCTTEEIASAFKGSYNYYFSPILSADKNGFPTATGGDISNPKSIGYTISGYPNIKRSESGSTKIKANISLAKYKSDNEWKILTVLIMENNNFPFERMYDLCTSCFGKGCWDCSYIGEWC